MKKPILFLDVDGVLNTRPPKKEDGDLDTRFFPPQEKNWWALARVPGAREFFLAAKKNFDVRWLSAWCLRGTMEPNKAVALSWLLRVFLEEVQDIVAVSWWDSKTEGIEEVLQANPTREWFWIDDEASEEERVWLTQNDAWDRVLRVDTLEHPEGLATITSLVKNPNLLQSMRLNTRLEPSEPLIDWSGGGRDALRKEKTPTKGQEA